MKWNQTVPCTSCPFLKTSGYLTKARAREIGKGMLDSQGIMFPCHLTTTEAEREDYDDEYDGNFIPQDHHIHCAGALIFAEKNKTATQMMRIAERLRLYDHRKLMSNKKVVDSVFDNLSQMVRTHGR